MTSETKPSDPSRDPLLRRPDESPQAFARFRFYRRLAAEHRTVAAAARLLRVSRQALNETAVRHEWRERVTAIPDYDPLREQPLPDWFQALDLEKLRGSAFGAWHRHHGADDATEGEAPPAP